MANNTINKKTRSIWIRDNEYNTDITSQCANLVIEAMLTLQQSTKPITLHIHSTGGDADAALAIYDIIHACRCETTMVGHGCVCSSASFIFQAADIRLLLPHSYLMIHRGEVELVSDAHAVRSWSEFWDKQANHMIDMYTKRMSQSTKFKSTGEARKYLKTLLTKHGDAVLTAQESVEIGLADKIIDKWPPKRN